MSFLTLYRLIFLFQSFLENLHNLSLGQGEVLSISLSFYACFATSRDSSTRLRAARKVFLDGDELPMVTKRDGDVGCLAAMAPIRMRVRVSGVEVKARLRANMAALEEFLQQKYKRYETVVDTYLVLLETFSFFLAHRSHFCRYYGIASQQKNYGQLRDVDLDEDFEVGIMYGNNRTKFKR